MQKDAVQQLFVVVAVFDPLGVGATFDRRQWPAHITLASNFVVAAPGERVARAVGEACADRRPMPVRFAGRAMFGRDRTVAVQLVDSAHVRRLHERLADLLEVVPGFSAAEPGYWRAGYRPHMTHTPTVTVRDGDIKRIACVAVAALTGVKATVTAAFVLSHTPDGA